MTNRGQFRVLRGALVAAALTVGLAGSAQAVPIVFNPPVGSAFPDISASSVTISFDGTTLTMNGTPGFYKDGVNPNIAIVPPPTPTAFSLTYNVNTNTGSFSILGAVPPLYAGGATPVLAGTLSAFDFIPGIDFIASATFNFLGAVTTDSIGTFGGPGALLGLQAGGNVLRDSLNDLIPAGQAGFGGNTADVFSQVPEPGTLSLLALGAAGLLRARRRTSR